MGWSLRLVAGTLAVAILLYVAFTALIYWQQRRLLYFPDRERVQPASVGLPEAREISLEADGIRILAWEIPPADDTKPVVLYLHGNGGNLTLRVTRFAELTQNGVGLLAVSWRGYGGSDGEPSEVGFREDAAAAVSHLRFLGIAPERLVIFGESLGSGIAVRLAAELPIRALILDSPYESIAAIAAARFPALPIDVLLRDPFRAIDSAPGVRAPVLAMACKGDWVTPYAGSLKLMAAITSPKRLISVDRACHIPGLSIAGKEVAELIATGRL